MIKYKILKILTVHLYVCLIRFITKNPAEPIYTRLLLGDSWYYRGWLRLLLFKKKSKIFYTRLIVFSQIRFVIPQTRLACCWKKRIFVINWNFVLRRKRSRYVVCIDLYEQLLLSEQLWDREKKSASFQVNPFYQATTMFLLFFLTRPTML